MNESFSLGGLMALGLHKYVDACSEIVDRAEKELSIENALKKIEDTWAALSLVFTPYQVWPALLYHVLDCIRPTKKRFHSGILCPLGPVDSIKHILCKRKKFIMGAGLQCDADGGG